jgi:hypothetical protein
MLDFGEIPIAGALAVGKSFVTTTETFVDWLRSCSLATTVKL